MTLDSSTHDPSALQAVDALASKLMKRGIGLLSEGRPESVIEAVTCFDDALELRRRLPIDAVPAFRYGLAACWLNRAEALMRSSDPSRIALAIRAFDEAIVLLCTLPLQDDVRYIRRLAIALQNRGLALQALGTAGEAAIGAFTQAIAVLDHDLASPIADRTYLLAAVWTNLASAYASEAIDRTDALASHAARRALALVTDLEQGVADAAEVGLKARHVLCRTIARRLSRSTDATLLLDEVHAATDLADDGLDLARRWEQKGETRFRDVALDLFRFGAGVYKRYQPRFLSEFVLENMDPARSSENYIGDAEMRSAAAEALGSQASSDPSPAPSSRLARRAHRRPRY